MTSIFYMIIKEMVLSMVGKIGWKIVGERMATRLVVYGLKKLESLSSNTVTTGLLRDIMLQLQNKKLKVIDEEYKEQPRKEYQNKTN